MKCYLLLDAHFTEHMGHTTGCHILNQQITNTTVSTLLQLPS